MSLGIVEAQDNDEVFKDVKLPSNVAELVKSFSYMSYDVVVINNGQKEQETTIEYDHLGKEEIDNVETDKVSFIVADSQNNDMPAEMLFWFNGTDIKKMEIDGQPIPAQMAGIMGENLLGAIFSPFYSLSEYNIDELSKMGQVTHSKEKFGGEDIDVTTIVVENIPEYEIESGVVKIGKYQGVSFVLSYNYVSSEEDLEIKFNVNEIEFN
ncbi:MAG: hypothetical protein U5K53_09600 [Halanaerobiales bacterium]|nr:hypothetical protein [Halanaerobiales bacterium]